MSRTKTINRINNFETPFLMAFERMMLVQIVTISDELRKTVRGSDIGITFHITSINQYGNVNLIGCNSNWKFKNVELKDIIF